MGDGRLGFLTQVSFHSRLACFGKDGRESIDPKEEERQRGGIPQSVGTLVPKDQMMINTFIDLSIG